MTITNFSIGIGLEFAPDFPTASTGNRSAYNTLLGNNITNNRVGIELASGSNNNALLGNNVSANQIGIFLFRVENNTLSGNTVANSGEGITLSFSSYNTIYHNNFINNTSQVHVIAFTDNIWDDGSKGNYWSDYLTKYPNATQVDSSGVWNTPYVIDDLNDTDHYPLMTQDLVPEFPSFLILPLFLTATPLTAMICRKRQTRTT
jgi:parallel beta-helix repeat protein